MNEVSEETQSLINKANKVFLDNFPAEACFERALFFSWYCSIRDCTFCFMSTQPDNPRFRTVGRRTQESLLAETVLCKHFGWDLGFLSGGIGSFEVKDFKEVIKNISTTYNEKIWLNVGPLSKKVLEDYSPYLKGIVGSIESVNPEVHKRICPSKPVEPYLKMFDCAEELRLKKAVTVITGVGETRDDFENLKSLITDYKINKVHIYSLVPEKGTVFQNTQIPSLDYHAWWIAQTRINFPKIDIQCGIWSDRVERISTLLMAGSNSVSKFPIIRKFATRQAKEIVEQAKKAGRLFKGNLTEMINLDWNRLVNELSIPEDLKNGVSQRLNMYLRMMEKNLKKQSVLVQIND